MTTSTQNLKTEIIALEKRYWDAMKSQDLQAALNLTHFPCLIAGSHGLQSVDRDQFEKMFASNEGKIQEAKIDESKTEVSQVGPDTAVIAYNVHSSFQKDGKTQEIDAVDTSTWIRKDNKWVCAMHTETELLH